MVIDIIKLKNGTLEYIDELHLYIYEGQILPSVSQILNIKFGKKYDGIPEHILKNAALRGTAIHQVIEDYEKDNIEDKGCIELSNWKFLKKEYKFKCLDNEVPIIIFKDEEPIACGRLDLVLEEDGKIGLGDIKTTSKLDTEHLEYQLNLYRIGFQQCYGKNIDFLRGVHLKGKVKKYVDIPIDEKKAIRLLEEFLESRE